MTAGPDPVDWLAALLRGLHPVRWLHCLIGLVLTGLSFTVAQSLFEQGPPDLLGWWHQPNEHLLALWDEIFGGSLGRMIIRGAPLLAVNAMLWSLIGAWIARHELLARRRARGDNAEDGEQPSIHSFMGRRLKNLLVCCPTVLCLAAVMLVPVLVAGWVNTWMGGPGAILVSVLVPVVLLANLIFLLLAAGAIAWPLMPIAIAAEGSDQFDALSRSYNYQYQYPIRFLVLTACAVGLAGLPLAALYFLPEQMAAWQLEVRWIVCALAAGLSASIFWSLQTLVYLHMRSAVDGVDANEVAVESPPEEGLGQRIGASTPSPPASGGERPLEGGSGAARDPDPLTPIPSHPKRGTREKPVPDVKAAATSLWKDGSAARGQKTIRPMLLALVAMAGTWCVTYWLFSRATQGPAEWLGWGLTGTFVPPAQGVHKVASIIAGFWGVVSLALPLLVAIRRLRRSGDAERESDRNGNTGPVREQE